MHNQVWVAETGRLSLPCRQSPSLNWSEPGWPSPLLFHCLWGPSSTCQSGMLPVRLPCWSRLKKTAKLEVWSPSTLVLIYAFTFAGTFILLRCLVVRTQWLLEGIAPLHRCLREPVIAQSQELAHQAGSCSVSCPCECYCLLALCSF